jgi:hypothetical protein
MSLLGKKPNIDEMKEAIVARYREVATKLELTDIKYEGLIKTFNDRYRQALSDRANLVAFLEAENGFIDNFVGQHLSQVATMAEYASKIEKGYMAFDKTTADIEARRLKYKKLELEDSNNDELMALFGAIDQLDREYWGIIAKHLRERFTIRTKSPLDRLEMELNTMVSGQIKRPPSILTQYCHAVRHNDTRVADDVAFAALKEVAFFLNDTIILLETTGFPLKSDAFIFISGVVDDFRLRDIKRKI